MRASIENARSKYKPGQQVQVYLTHSSKEALAIPIDAVIRDGNGSHVYIQAGHNTFQPRMVKIGLESFDQVEITEGLNEGDTIAISGAYLLYSEIILKKGTDPMAGHTH
jgi:Cu(I)/Ag(I) efflux system membrane fusion protein